MGNAVVGNDFIDGIRWKCFNFYLGEFVQGMKYIVTLNACVIQSK